MRVDIHDWWPALQTHCHSGGYFVTALSLAMAMIIMMLGNNDDAVDYDVDDGIGDGH